MTFSPSMMLVIFGLLFLLVALLVWKSLQKLTTQVGNTYDWHDLLMEHGKASKAAHVMLGAFAVTTWAMVYLTLSDKLTEGYMGLYMTAWVAPVVTRLIAKPAPEVKP